MSTRKRRGLRGKGGKRKGGLFIDVIQDGYIRDITLNKWREIEDLAAVNELTPQAAVAEAGVFPERGAYSVLWRRAWQAQFGGVPGNGGEGEPATEEASPETPVLSVASVLSVAPEAIFMRIEAAVRSALTEEIGLRRERGEGDLEDTSHYKAFVDREMELLLEDAHGEIEDEI